MELLPERTVERLSQYRRALRRLSDIDKEYIYSHELAKLLHITPVQVRRDIMLIGYTGTLRKGYNIKELINLISSIIDCSRGEQKVALVGYGNLGKALARYISTNETKLVLAAIFDANPEKIGKVYHGIVCHSVDKLEEIIRRDGITISILTIPPEHAQSIANRVVDAGVRGIINYTPVSLQTESAFLEQYDMITSLEKVAYFSKPKFHL